MEEQLVALQPRVDQWLVSDLTLRSGGSNRSVFVVGSDVGVGRVLSVHFDL